MAANKKTYLFTGYTPADFDAHWCLKVPFPLLVAMLYLTRNLLLPLAIFGAQRKTGSTDLNYLLGGISSFDMLGSLPSLLVLLAWVKRSPKGGRAVRWIWFNGRWFLAAGAVADICIRLWMTTNWLKTFAAAQVLLDLYILVYLMIARKVKDVFSDFPAS